MSILRYFLLSIQLTTLVANTSFAYERYNFFSLLTYNVAGLPDYFSGSNPANNSALISPLLNNYDIVLMQEDFIYHRDIVSASRHRYRSQTDCDFYAASPIEPKGGAQCLIEFGDGLNRLSRFPFSQFRRVTWNDCYGYFDNAMSLTSTRSSPVSG